MIRQTKAKKEAGTDVKLFQSNGLKREPAQPVSKGRVDTHSNSDTSSQPESGCLGGAQAGLGLGPQ